jgi:predicted outer membrane repeat protein
MQRWFRLSSLLLVLTAAFASVRAQDYVEVRGSLPPGQVRVFVRDTIYRISGTYTIGGTLLIEPGTRVEFLPNGRMIDSTGGRIIADGRASATYNPNVVGVDPAAFPNGYADLNYFGSAGVVTSTIATEPTIATAKHGLLFHVDLGADPNLQNLTPAEAIMFKAARLELGNVQQAIRQNPWFRPKNNSPINVRPDRITFVAGDVNNFSREWGHIIVLPGARTAFFRDVDFTGFRKDTTVDTEPIYLRDANGTTFATRDAALARNNRILTATNGGGGAITTFSSRTWIVGCRFTNNMARYRGGALQILQAPENLDQLYPVVSQSSIDALGFYPSQVNPYITDPVNAQPIPQQIPAIDLAYTNTNEPLSDEARQSLDDARLALYLGRIRQTRFVNNRALLADVEAVRVGNITVVRDVDSRAATTFGTLGRSQKNDAFGGAVYIEGRTPLFVGFGVNDFQGKDTLEFSGNYALNRQNSNAVNNQRTGGAKGGAIYVGGSNTSLILAGRFVSNRTEVPFIPNVKIENGNRESSAATYSHGGAVYFGGSNNQLHIRGNLDNNPPTHFLSNTSGIGGAVYVASGVQTASPIIGGSDGLIVARNFGFNIKFRDNRAIAHGGAVYTGRNMQVHGAGGTSGPLWVYGNNYGVEFSNNVAGYSGGAIAVHLTQGLPIFQRNLRFVRSSFVNNRVGEVGDTARDQVRGGGALYTINADLNVVKGAEFRANKVWNGNGGAIAVVTPDTLTRKRFMVTDLDNITYDGQGVATGYAGRDDVFTYGVASPRPDERMLTRFYDNVAYENPTRLGNGTTQRGNANNLTHPGSGLRENGTGLGGALYILDSVRVRVDTFNFDRVRFQSNMAFSGAAIYSDNYDLKLALKRNLITGNIATSNIGRANDTISGPVNGTENPASSDLAGAVLYGEVVGPLPFNSFSAAANSIYANDARFLIRLPDAQDTKGVLAGTTGLGFGGVDTLRGNYWGRTEANVNTILPISNNNTFQRIQETFFIAGDGRTHMRFVRAATSNTTEQGPFESTQFFTYKPVPNHTIPDTLLMQGRIYDIFDKGTDIKTADYSRRRMSPIEDFAVGVPPVLRSYINPEQPSNGKYVKRMTRDPFHAEQFDYIARVQTEFVGDHPIGYPLFLEARADYSQTAEVSNNDPRSINESVFFVINERTGDYIRVNFAQKGLTDTIYRARVELVPDSTNGSDPNIRRSIENLSSYGTGATLLSRLARDGAAEDSSALVGRRWEGSTLLGELGGVGFRLGNRPGLPISNNGKETYYGGERFRALPVVDGDLVTVVSRTVLWRDGVIPALQGALQFRVGTSTNPPVFTGSADTLADSPLLSAEMRNRVFVTENRLYTPVTSAASPRRADGRPWFDEPATYRPTSSVAAIANSQRDSIFTITAVDVNRFFDPRVILDPSKGAQLSYFWNIVDTNNPAKYWLRDRLTTATNTETKWSARGYRELIGRPINPYIVPGGEEIEVVAKNFPPSIETLDSLRAAGIGEDTLNKFLYLYPSYFHAEAYDNNALAADQRDQDNTNARFLQQDTVNIGFNDTTSYRFRIYVVDSMPQFVWTSGNNISRDFVQGPTTVVLDPTTNNPNTFDATTNTYRDTLRYVPSFSRVGRTLTAPNAILSENYNDPADVQNDLQNIQFVANLTDSLRFRVDINTTDEAEDSVATAADRFVVQRHGAWDFRYGKTAYGFLATSVRDTPGDTTPDGLRVARPIWMSNQYLRRFNNPGQADQFAEDFTSKGKIDIRIPNDVAREILKPINDRNPGRPEHEDLNTDTVVTFVVNDGHGGINYMTRRVFVNVEPQIRTTQLPDAREDEDYNPALLDSARRIMVYDPNFGQDATFELIYVDDQRTSIPRDPYFPEAGEIDLTNRRTTPRWLKINTESGMLYGTPRVTDTPFPDTTVQVTVLVRDAGNLSAITTLDLRIVAVNHKPKLLESPIIRCVDNGSAYEDRIKVTDIDLARLQANNEELTFEVLQPAGTWTFTPTPVASNSADTVEVTIRGTALNDDDNDGRVRIVVRVTDKQGESADLTYFVTVSAETRFTNVIRVENNLGAFQDLTWGVGGTQLATRGDEDGTFGQLDSNYCEFEIPPVTYLDVFDARWTVPARTGVLRNIYPFSNQPGEAVYRATYQPGGENGQTSLAFPIKITWCRESIPDRSTASPGSFQIRDASSNGNFFRFDMKTGQGFAAGGFVKKEGNGCDTIIVTETTIGGFIIVYDFTTSVDDAGNEVSLAITGTVPNPFSESTRIDFTSPGTRKVAVEIFDAMGARVATLADEVMPQGPRSLDWDGKSNGVALANGVYTVRISDGLTSMTQQIVLVR